MVQSGEQGQGGIPVLPESDFESKVVIGSQEGSDSLRLCFKCVCLQDAFRAVDVLFTVLLQWMMSPHVCQNPQNVQYQ